MRPGSTAARVTGRLAAALVLGLVASGLPAAVSADHGGVPNLTVTPSASLSNSGPVPIHVSATGLPPSEVVTVSRCKLILGTITADCGALVFPETDASGNLDVDTTVQWSYAPGDACDWSATVGCDIRVFRDEGDGVVLVDKAEISFAGHDTRNAPPICSNVEADAVTTGPVTFSLDCTDPEEDPLTYAITTPPTHGQVVGTAPLLTYVSDSGFVGTEILQYRASDATGQSDTATVTIEVASLGPMTVTVAPPTGLADVGQVPVSVLGSGFPPGAQVGISQCRVHGPSGTSCDTFTTNVPVGAFGTFSATVNVHYDAGIADGLCDWSATHRCEIRVWQIPGGNGLTDYVAAEIVFAGHDNRGAGPLDHLALSPASSSITSGASRTYIARGEDADGTDLGDLTDSVTFTIAPNGSCAGNACTASLAGTHTITGALGGVTGTATLAVTPGPLHHLDLAPATATIPAGSTQTYAARGRDVVGNDRGDVTAATTFTITPDGSCAGSACGSGSGGPHTVLGSSAGASGTASLTITAPPASPSNLRVTQTRSPTTVLGGQTITFTGTVTNLGPGASSGVRVSDPLASTLAFVSASASAGSCAEVAGVVTCSLGTIANQGVVTITIVARGVAIGTGQQNTMTASCTCTDPVAANDQVSVGFTVAAASDLEVVSSVGPATAPYLEQATWTSIVRNNGISEANVTIRDVLVAGSQTVAWSGVSATVSRGNCQFSGREAVCIVPHMLPGESVQVVVTYLAVGPPTQPFRNRVTLSCSCSDPNSANDTLFAAFTTFVYVADLSGGVVGPATATDGATFRWTWTISNPSGLTIPQVTLIVTLSPGQTFVSGTGCRAVGLVVTCLLTNVQAGLTSGFIIVRPSGPGPVTAVIAIACGCVDPNVPNNGASSPTVIVNPSSDLRITTTGPAQTFIGTPTRFTGEVVNLGPSEAANVTVTVNLPAWVTIGSVTVSQGTCAVTQPSGGQGGRVVCTIGSIAVGAPIVIVIWCTPLSTTSGNLRPQFVTSCGCNDPVPSNNTVVTIPCKVNPWSDLRVVAIDPSGPFYAGELLDLVVRVDNLGPSLANDGSVQIVLPPGTIFSGWSGPGGVTCTPSGLTITCKFGRVPVGGSLTIVIQATPDHGTFPGATVTVICGCTDLAPGNNSGNAGGGIVMPRICIPIGDILFTTDREGDRDIYSMGTDGSHPQNVTRDGPLDDHTAAWAPDHTRFAYAAADPGEDHRIRIVTLGPDRCIDTDREIPNQPNGNNLAPRWSPDGQRLALHSNAGGTLDVWVMNASGGGLSRVAVSGYTDSTPTWSGDGRWIAFQSNRGTSGTADYEIWITRSDGSGIPRRLTSDGFNDFGPMFAYAPSNRLIWHSKSSASELTFDLWVGDVNFTTGAMSNVRRFVARPNDVDGNGWFSPGNDNAAVFDSRPGPGPTDVWIWDGSNATNLTNHPANDEAPSW